MKKTILRLTAAGLFTLCTAVAQAQGPGLVISELMPNPPSTDSPYEYVELVATRAIDFSVTPYSVVFTNNSATANGWIAGGTTTYGFNINTGTVAAGDIVYVGGTLMSPTGTKLRIINTGTTAGDGFGTASSGPLGNGGGNADAVGVFDVAVTAITTTTRPVDAVFFGTGIGDAEFAGTGGYTLPYNDLYPGGTVTATAFTAPDPGGGDAIQVTGGVFNTTTQSFTTVRTFAIGTTTDNATSIVLNTSPNSVSFAMATTNQTVSESAGSASFNITVTNPNNAQAIIRVDASALSNATAATDYTLTNNIFVVPAASTTTQTVNLTIADDGASESDEYILFSITPLTNAVTTGGNLHALYIKDNDNAAPVASNQLKLDLLSSYGNGTEGTNSTEIVAHDYTTHRLYVANSIGAKLDILDFSNPAAITPIASINITPYGNINSVAVHNGLVAAAIENGTNPQDSGKVVFFDMNGTFISSVKTGAMPDMITFNHAGDKIVVACEGEPNTDYTSDPEGRVVVVDLTGGAASLTQSDATFINFTAYIGQEATLRASGIRIYGPGANAAQDFEPEYVTISDDDQTAWVTLQENNALALIDLSTNTITQLMPLGFKDHNALGNGMDASDQAAGINLANFPIKGMYLPDAISHINIGGTDYVITANEGDARAYDGFSEESRISGLTLDPTAYPQGAQLKANVVAGRLTVTNALGDTDGDGDIDQIYSMGARSFSIWNGATGALVYDSGDDFERITSTHPTFAAMFNASNTSGAIASKNRSDDKGPETEGVTVAEFDGQYYAFASLERVGGVMVYNITNPVNPTFVGYYNNRNLATNGPDRGAEGMIFITPEQSPNGSALLLLANEVSSSLSVFQVNTCRRLSGVELMGDTTLCGTGDSANVYTANAAGVSYQWYQDGSIMAGETDSLVTVNAPGEYALGFVNSAEMCADTTSITVTVLPVPAPLISLVGTELTTGTYTTMQWYVDGNPIAGAIGATHTPLVNGVYTVTVTNTSGCEGTSAPYNFTTVGLTALEAGSFNVYPNPFNQQITIQCPAGIQPDITVLNSYGQVVYTAKAYNGGAITLDNVANGLYILQITTAGGQTRVPVMKQ